MGQLVRDKPAGGCTGRDELTAALDLQKIHGALGRVLAGLILGMAERMLVPTEGVGVSMAEKKIEKCAHPGCNCPAAGLRESSVYCVQLPACGVWRRRDGGCGSISGRTKSSADLVGLPAFFAVVAFRYRKGGARWRQAHNPSQRQALVPS
jgi:hypothetical protein